VKDETVETVRYLTAVTALGLFTYSGIDTTGLQDWTASVVADVLRDWGVSIPRHANVFHLHGMNAVIIKGCVVWPAISLFIALIVPIPGASWWRKAAACAVSFAILTVGNIFRLAFMFYMMRAWGVSFHVAHDIVSQIVGLILVIIAGWVCFRILPEFEEWLHRIYNFFLLRT